MKKQIMLLVMAIAIVSCGSDDSNRPTESNYEELTPEKNIYTFEAVADKRYKISQASYELLSQGNFEANCSLEDYNYEFEYTSDAGEVYLQLANSVESNSICFTVDNEDLSNELINEGFEHVALLASKDTQVIVSSYGEVPTFNLISFVIASDDVSPQDLRSKISEEDYKKYLSGRVNGCEDNDTSNSVNIVYSSDFGNVSILAHKMDSTVCVSLDEQDVTDEFIRDGYNAPFLMSSKGATVIVSMDSLKLGLDKYQEVIK